MKKILPFLMVLMVLFAFIACDNGGGDNSDSAGGSTGGGSGGGSSSTGGNASYVGTWTGTMVGDVSLSITLNADGTVSAYNSMQGTQLVFGQLLIQVL